MPNYRRANIDGGTYFFTVNTLSRQTFLLDDDVRAALREGLALVRQSHPFTVNAWALLPDHLHCIWHCRPMIVISRRVGGSSNAPCRNAAAPV